MKHWFSEDKSIRLYQGDCLEVNVDIDENKICDMYLDGESMRSIASKFNTNHKRISRILKKHNISTRDPKRLRGYKKFDNDFYRKCHNMATHIRFDVDYTWYSQFDNIDKLKILNEIITNRENRFNETTEWYKCYINKFYYDSQFNLIYNNWIESDYDIFKKPSIDHIIPISKGGTNDINNLQILTWLENRCKANIHQDKWNIIKKNIHEYFI